MQVAAHFLMRPQADLVYDIFTNILTPFIFTYITNSIYGVYQRFENRWFNSGNNNIDFLNIKQTVKLGTESFDIQEKN